MKDLIGEKTALERTRVIIAQIDVKEMHPKLYRDLVRQIYKNQLQKFTNYNRVTIRKMAKELGAKRTKGKQR